MRRDESAALLVLLRTGAQPRQRYADLVEQAGSAVAVLEQERDERGGEQASLLAAEDALERTKELDQLLATAASEIKGWRADGMRLLTVLDADYPENLRTVHDRPPMIFVAGGLEPRDARSVAVIGARNASAEGTSAARAIAVHLAQAGFTVFSGLAAGIDTAAHLAALGAGGRTVAVIGTGLRRVYPSQNAELQRRIIREGAVISQFWPEQPPSRQAFPMRNAVMSGLTLGSVVVEASRTSGARSQARLALAHGRPVFLRRQMMGEDWAREFAQQPGTHVVSEPAEITRIVERLTSAGMLSQ
jgi:DNA processing protein